MQRNKKIHTLQPCIYGDNLDSPLVGPLTPVSPAEIFSKFLKLISCTGHYYFMLKPDFKRTKMLS